MVSSRSEWPVRFWSGDFDGRTFLTKAEWETYLRREPVRYTRSEKGGEMPPARRCSYCHRPGTKDNPLQLAHKINALNGVRYFALTPDYLDEPDLLAWAHRKECNNRVEFDYGESLVYLRDHGIRELPTFLPKEILGDWRDLAGGRSRARK
jgi:hypothetical protein